MKILIVSLIIFFCTVFGLNSKLNKNFSNYDLVYNYQLYLNCKSNEDELLKENLCSEIISKLNRLVVLQYKYKPEDTLYTVAKKFGTDVNSIRSTNYIEAIGLLYPGKLLIVHNKKGLLYKVKPNEDLYSIAKKFKKEPQQLLLVNDKPGNYKFSAGEYIFIPETYIKFKDFMLPLFNTRITSQFGERIHPIFQTLKFHEGIDLKQRYGAAVRAACDGKVIFAGWAEGYGKLIILKHHKGYTSYYGHLSKIRVKPGQKVYKGQIIGNVGTTGWTTGPHLHFEIRKNGVPVNPLKVVF